tara:strand:+ start:199 stop:396 length:198 start_codon:yes stop_codon:yes gene_type:complete
METLDGVTVNVGERAFDYYDRRVVWLREVDPDGWGEWDTSSGEIAILNGERVISLEKARNMEMGV